MRAIISARSLRLFSSIAAWVAVLGLFFLSASALKPLPLRWKPVCSSVDRAIYSSIGKLCWAVKGTAAQSIWPEFLTRMIAPGALSPRSSMVESPIARSPITGRGLLVL